MTFDFATAHRIVFGDGALQQAGKLVAELGNRALVVTFNSSDRAQPLLDLLGAAGVEHRAFRSARGAEGPRSAGRAGAGARRTL